MSTKVLSHSVYPLAPVYNYDNQWLKIQYFLNPETLIHAAT